jgi:transposase-like protein
MLEDAVALAPAIGQINGQTLELVETVGLVGTAVKEDLVQAIDTAEDRFSDFQETWSEGMGSLVNAIGGLALDIISAFEDMNREVMQNRIASYEETSREIEDINQKLVDTVDAAEKKRLLAEKARLQEESEAQKEAALEAFHTQKALAIAAASINTALAVINAFATAPNIVMGAVMAVIAGAAGAVSIATIAAEQPPSFHSGGVLRASDLQGATMDSMMIRAKPGEGVLSTAGVAAAGGAEGVDALNAGRTTGRGTTVNVIRFGTRTTEAISHQQLQPKVGRSIPGRR